MSLKKLNTKQITKSMVLLGHNAEVLLYRVYAQNAIFSSN